jgi:hypothetical protein
MTAPQSIRSKIADALMARLALVTDLKYRAFDTVRLQASDFADYEIPAVQIIDLAELTTHEQRRGKKEWNLVIEVIIGPTEAEAVTQQKLWDLMQLIEETIWEVPNLGLTDVIHAKLLTTSTDLHLMAPFYLGRIELSVLYYQPLVGTC